MVEEPRPENLGYIREELQRMRAELCGFVDRTPNILQLDPETHSFDVDVAAITQGGFATQFDALYQGNGLALVDDVLFYRFVRATRTYIETVDDISRRRIADDEFVPYMEYLLNTPRTPEEQVMMGAVGYQPLDDKTREKVINGLGFLFGTPSEALPFGRLYQPRFSPEYKEYFLKNNRKEYMYADEYDPTDTEALIESFIDKIAKGFVSIMDIPQDKSRDDLPIPTAEFINPSEHISSPLVKSVLEGVNRVLAKLALIERRLIMLRFGLEDGESRTVAETAKILGLTIDEVKALEIKVLRNLRNKDK